jgi:hypothetical protein
VASGAFPSQPDAGQSTTAGSSLKGRIAVLFVNLLAIILLLCALEVLIVLSLNHPPRSLLVRRVLSGYYTDVDRAIIQFLPECAQYDHELGYLLRHGSCRFSNRGFDTTVAVNSQGVRDSEEALERPDVIVVGDSFAMGWGVEGVEAFPKLLEERCELRVLNAAISSYGTAREMALLKRLDLSGIRWLIVQYSDNDMRENQEFRDRGNRLVAMSHEDYVALQRMVVGRLRYFPGKHILRFFPHTGERLRSRTGSTVDEAGPTAINGVDVDRVEAQLFLNALISAPLLPEGTRVVALEINGRAKNDGRFAAALRQELASADYPEPWQSMSVLDLAPLLEIEHFLPLDDHLSASGHVVIADALGQAMGCTTRGAS